MSERNCGNCYRWKKESDGWIRYDRTGKEDGEVEAFGTCEFPMPFFLRKSTDASDGKQCTAFIDKA